MLSHWQIRCVDQSDRVFACPVLKPERALEDDAAENHVFAPVISILAKHSFSKHQSAQLRSYVSSSEKTGGMFHAITVNPQQCKL